MEEKNQAKAKVPRRPNRLLLVLVCALVAVVAVVSGLLIGLVVPHADIAAVFLSAPDYESQEVIDAAQATAEITEEVESEAVILLKNEGDALPLDGSPKVVVLGSTAGY